MQLSEKELNATRLHSLDYLKCDGMHSVPFNPVSLRFFPFNLGNIG